MHADQDLEEAIALWKKTKGNLNSQPFTHTMHSPLAIFCNSIRQQVGSTKAAKPDLSFRLKFGLLSVHTWWVLGCTEHALAIQAPESLRESVNRAASRILAASQPVYHSLLGPISNHPGGAIKQHRSIESDVLLIFQSPGRNAYCSRSL